MKYRELLNRNAEIIKEKAAKLACIKCDAVSTELAWKKNNGSCPKCNKSTQGVLQEMTIVNEILGLEKVPGLKGYGQGDYNRRTSRPEGRPVGSTKDGVKPRPNKNLWYNDDKMWYNELDIYNEPGTLKLVADENEEKVVLAVDKESGTKVYGKWDAVNKKGVTFKTPKRMQHVAPLKTSFKDFVVKS